MDHERQHEYDVRGLVLVNCGSADIGHTRLADVPEVQGIAV